MLFEAVAEIAGVGQAHLARHLGGAQVAAAEQRERPVHAQLGQVLVEGFPGFFFKDGASSCIPPESDIKSRHSDINFTFSI